jgi:hypothetical protein
MNTGYELSDEKGNWRKPINVRLTNKSDLESKGSNQETLSRPATPLKLILSNNPFRRQLGRILTPRTCDFFLRKPKMRHRHLVKRAASSLTINVS